VRALLASSVWLGALVAAGPALAQQLDEAALAPFEGKPVASISLSGFRVTKEYVIQRELRLQAGDPFSLEELRADVVRLQNLNVFASIDVSPATAPGDAVALEYTFKEMPSFIPFPAFTFTEENGFSYGAGLSALNFTGRDIQVSFRALTGGTSTLSLKVTYPWITGNHVFIDFVAAHLERNDELRDFFETSDELTPWVGTWFGGDRGRLKGTVSFFRLRSDVDGITIDADNDDQLRRIGLAVGWDTRDSWRNPHQGWQNELQVFRTGGWLGGDGDFWTVDADLRRFQPLAARHTLVVGSLLTLQSGESGVDVPRYMRYHVGGSTSIRGYSVDDLAKRLSGKNQSLGTVEYRYTLLEPKRWDVFKWSINLGLELAAFADVGLAWDTSDEFEFGRYRAGVGAGVRLLVPGSEQTRLDVGWSREGGFQFHFGSWSKLSAQRFRLR